MEIWRSHVLVCAGAGCVSSGCREVRDNLIQGVMEFGLQGEVKVIETGCIGSCDLGPIVVVYPEGFFYQKVKAEDVRVIAEEHLFKGRVVERLLYTEPTTTQIIPTFKEIDFFKLQEKIVLRNCGLIDPMNIEEYIAREGYEGLAQVLTRMTPQEVVEVVQRSGLRGRGGAGFPAGTKWRFTQQAQGFKAVFLATGAHRGLKLGIAGERLKGVLDGVSFLRDVNLGKPVKVGERVAVIGGGNVAIDAARTALRLGAKDVQIFYRRQREDMPAADWEVAEAEKEGVKIHYLVAPAQMWGGNGGLVRRMECRRMVLSDFDPSGRKRPIAIAGSEFEVDVDTVIAAIGQFPDTECFRGNGFRFDSRGAFLVVPENLATGTPGVFAGGDNVRGPASAVEAIADGQKAARAIDKFLGGDGLLPNTYRERLKGIKVSYNEEAYAEEHPRISVPQIPLTDRYHNFREVEVGYTTRLAVEEAKRCLHCYRQE